MDNTTKELFLIGMSETKLSMREIKQDDITHLVNYWIYADKDYLLSMGADPAKITEAKDLRETLSEQLHQSYAEKKSYCIIWLYDDQPIGHSNVNKIVFGEEAFMHLHIWKKEHRKKGWGAELVEMTIPLFFKNLQLKKLFCEPYALNEAPNKILKNAGFTFVKNYITTPGWINFEQPVNLWEMKKENAIFDSHL